MARFEDGMGADTELRSRQAQTSFGAQPLEDDSSENLFDPTPTNGTELHTTMYLDHAHTLLVYGNNPTDYSNIAQSCLFIPLFFGMWWYWTKRAAERLTMTNTEDKFDNEEDDDRYDTLPPVIPAKKDVFQDWDDVLMRSTPDESIHFVKWIRSRQGLCANNKRSSSSQKPLPIVRSDERNMPSMTHVDQSTPLSTLTQHTESQQYLGQQQAINDDDCRIRDETTPLFSNGAPATEEKESGNWEEIDDTHAGFSMRNGSSHIPPPAPTTSWFWRVKKNG